MRSISLTNSFAAAMLTAFAITGLAVAEEVTPNEIPKNSYYDDPLTNTERSGIASEEDVSPNDGRASVPAPGEQSVIPDAADPEKGDTVVNAPADGALPGDTDAKGKKTSESEADVVIDQSKENFRVTRNEYNKCVGQWDPQTQMSKDQWAASCRDTLQYFPESANE